MLKKWISAGTLTLAGALTVAGCTQEVNDGATANRTPIDHSTNKQSQNRPIAMTGCLGAGTGTNAYVLTHVRLAPLGEQPSDTPSAANLNLAENSAVRLTSGDSKKLTELVGQTVSVTGLLQHDGRNTIGTSGPPRTPGQPEPRTDQSQAATSQHPSEKVREEAGPIGNQSMNNGTYPELAVQEVTGTGQKCVTSPTTDRR